MSCTLRITSAPPDKIFHFAKCELPIDSRSHHLSLPGALDVSHYSSQLVLKFINKGRKLTTEDHLLCKKLTK